MTQHKHDASFFFPNPVSQRFCNQCGAELSRIIPPGDNELRDTCLACGAVHYRNPLIVVGALPIYNNKVLLCKRAIEPRYGTWTFPAGFLELSETTAQGAKRETLEEAGAQVEIGDLFTIIDVPGTNQLHLYYLAQALNDQLDPGIESLEAAYFDIQDIPWDELAFRSIRTTLEHYVQALESGDFGPFNYVIE